MPSVGFVWVDQGAPVATAECFAKAQHAKDLLRSLMRKFAPQEMLKPRLGRPPLAAPKEHVNIRLDADIVQSSRRTGEGWQARLNNALREWLRAHAACASAVTE